MRKRTYEPTEFLSFAQRIVRRSGERVAGEGDAADLAELASMRAAVDAAVLVAVRGLRERGWSWGQIAGELQISRQAAQQAFGHKIAS